MILLAIDPGPEYSAWLRYDTVSGQPLGWCKDRNEHVLGLLEQIGDGGFDPVDALAIEMIGSYGMPVGREVFQTCCWIGRFDHAYSLAMPDRAEALLIYRQEVKLHLCHSARANDATIRQALIDRYGPGKDRAIGRKASPGPLYGITGDCWSALAIAVTATATVLDRQERAA